MDCYTPKTHPKMYRNDKMTAAAWLRENRRLSWQWDGAAFCGDSEAMERISNLQSVLYAAYKAGR